MFLLSTLTTILLLLILSLLSPASATCYWPPGNATYARDLTEHQPCSSDPTSPLSTICCALNRTNPSGGDKIYGRTNDECLPNGVCRNRVLDHGTMQVSYWRETCTSQDWKTGLCLDVCADDWTSGNGTTGAVMTPCDGTATSLKWCCGVNTECCNDPSRVKTLAFEFRGALPNTASATPRPLPSATGTPAPSSPVPAPSHGGLSTGAKAGIGVGAAAGGIALIAVGIFIARLAGRKGKQQQQPYDPGYGAMQSPPLVPPMAPPPEKQVYRHEMENQARAELAYSPAQPGHEGRKQTPSYELS